MPRQKGFFLSIALTFDYAIICALCRYDDYIECVHKSKQNLRVKAMHKKRHVDNHIEYLQVGHHIDEDKQIQVSYFQGKRTYGETYEAPPKAHAYVEPWHDAK